MPTSRAATATRTENALLPHLGPLHGASPDLWLHHDNRLVLGSRQYLSLVRSCDLTQGYIAPHTPEQNGLCERFIRIFKLGWVCLQTFDSIEDARAHITAFINSLLVQSECTNAGKRLSYSRNG